MSDNEKELRAKADQFLRENLSKPKAVSRIPDHSRENDINEIRESVKAQMRLEAKSFQNSKELLEAIHKKSVEPKGDKKPIDWTGYFILGVLGVTALVLLAYGFMLALIIIPVAIIQQIIWKK